MNSNKHRGHVSGNVWEWNEETFGFGPFLRGGSFNSDVTSLQAQIRSLSGPTGATNY